MNDVDADGICDSTDSCPGDDINDADADGICDSVDSCLSDNRNDGDSDSVCDSIDSCVGDPLNDADSDRICDSVNSCNDAENDEDFDHICDAVDSCRNDATNDSDNDGICDKQDSCVGDSINDADSDGLCATTDSCPFDSANDIDSDDLCGDEDSCPLDPWNDADTDGKCGGGGGSRNISLSIPLDELLDVNASAVGPITNENVTKLLCGKLGGSSCGSVSTDDCSGFATVGLPGGVSMHVSQALVVTIDVDLLPSFNFSSCDALSNAEVSDVNSLGINVSEFNCPAACGSRVQSCGSVSAVISVNPNSTAQGKVDVCVWVPNKCSGQITKPASCAFQDSDSDGLSDLVDACPLNPQADCSGICDFCTSSSLTVTYTGVAAGQAQLGSSALDLTAGLVSSLGGLDTSALGGNPLSNVGGRSSSSSVVVNVELVASPGDIFSGTAVSGLGGLHDVMNIVADLSPATTTTMWQPSSSSSTTQSTTPRLDGSATAPSADPVVVGASAAAAIALIIVIVVAVVCVVKRSRKRIVAVHENGAVVKRESGLHHREHRAEGHESVMSKRIIRSITRREIGTTSTNGGMVEVDTRSFKPRVVVPVSESGKHEANSSREHFNTMPIATARSSNLDTKRSVIALADASARLEAIKLQNRLRSRKGVSSSRRRANAGLSASVQSCAEDSQCVSYSNDHVIDVEGEGPPIDDSKLHESPSGITVGVCADPATHTDAQILDVDDEVRALSPAGTPVGATRKVPSAVVKPDLPEPVGSYLIGAASTQADLRSRQRGRRRVVRQLSSKSAVPDTKPVEISRVRRVRTQRPVAKTVKISSTSMEEI
eukprot:INCI1190.1.p1 GENE.INCI1190.1~~INCI1190.1.p1  ORF type:complete len:874 (+),score=186.09 INCI1190.1:135-2624(+)